MKYSLDIDIEAESPSESIGTTAISGARKITVLYNTRRISCQGRSRAAIGCALQFTQKSTPHAYASSYAISIRITRTKSVSNAPKGVRNRVHVPICIRIVKSGPTMIGDTRAKASEPVSNAPKKRLASASSKSGPTMTRDTHKKASDLDAEPETRQVKHAPSDLSEQLQDFVIDEVIG
jgi:hypothetical protein